MKLSTQTGVIDRLFGVDTSLRMIAEAGFPAVDYSLTGKNIPWEEAPFNDPSSPGFAAFFRRAGEAAEERGIEIYMSHAPYCPTNRTDPSDFLALRRQIVLSIHAAGRLGCPHLVVHPVLHPDFDNGQNVDKAVQVNVDYFSPLAGILRETGVTLCIENLFRGEYGKPKIANACSGAEQLSAVIDTLNAAHGPLFAACLDTGHAVVTGNDPAEMLAALGSRVRVLHLHDNLGVLDDHLLPGKGIIDWPRFLKTLGRSGFDGTMNFEADVFLSDFAGGFYDEAVMAEAVRLLYSVGRRMLAMAEEG